MSVNSPDEVIDPAHRQSEGTIVNIPLKITNQKKADMSGLKGNQLAKAVDKDNLDNCLPNEDIENVNRCKGNSIDQEMEENRNLGSSSNSSASSGSLGDDRSSHNTPVSIRDNLYHPGVDANLPLEVLNPILDLVDDDDEDAFGMPLSQQDEKLLEELLR